MTCPSNAEQFSSKIRAHALRMVNSAGASHIGSALSMADILGVLYTEVLHVDPARPAWKHRDRLIVSKGHAAAVLYAALAERGFFPVESLAGYCKDGSLLLGHVSHHVPGVEVSTGSLGHGLPIGCGMALAARCDGLDSRTFVILGDGELDEGSNWEAILFAGHNRLNHLTAIVDCNQLQSFGKVKDVLDLDPLAAKWEACHWHAMEVDGHCHTQLQRALQHAHRVTDKPSVIIAHTVKGNGVSYMEDRLEWHYKTPNAAQLQQALVELGYSA